MTAAEPPALPGPRASTGAPYRIAVVCLGNICRSPIADVVLQDRLDTAGLSDRVEVVSAGTGGWHVGDPMDPRAAAILGAHGYDASRHRGRRFGPEWFDEVDLVLAMDAGNYADITAQGPASRVRMFRDFDPHVGEALGDDRDVPDPYFGGDDGFDEVLVMVERTADALVTALARRDAAGSATGFVTGSATGFVTGSATGSVTGSVTGEVDD